MVKKLLEKWIDAVTSSPSGANGADSKGSGCLVESRCSLIHRNLPLVGNSIFTLMSLQGAAGVRTGEFPDQSSCSV